MCLFMRLDWNSKVFTICLERKERETKSKVYKNICFPEKIDILPTCIHMRCKISTYKNNIVHESLSWKSLPAFILKKNHIILNLCVYVICLRRYAVVASGCASCPKLRCERPGCASYFCYHCKATWHPNQTCDAARAERSANVRSSTFNRDSQNSK